MINRKKRLYAIAYERYLEGQIYPRIDYLHAETERHAKAQFYRGISFKHLKQIKLIGISVVVGYHVHDEHGEKLSVD